MIRRHLFSLLLVCAVLSCNKPLPDYSNLPFVYSVSGIQDITVPSNDRSSFAVVITLVSGNPATHPIEVTFRGLPPRVYVGNGGSFRANYQFRDSFIATNAAEGTYPVQAIFTSPGIDTVTETFNLTIGAPLNRVAGIVGNFNASNSCGENVSFGSFFLADPGHPYSCFLLEHISPSYYTANAWWDTTYCIIDSFSNNLTLPLQLVHGATITGEGSFSPGSSVVLTRNYITDTSAYSCTVMFAPAL